MPKSKNKNRELMTGSLKIKPKKSRPGLVKQLSQPFFSSKKKNKNEDFTEPVVLISTRSKDDMVLLNGYEDIFIPDGNRNSENVFLSPVETDDDTIEFDRSPLKIKLPPREPCSSSDSGYTSPPCPNEEKHSVVSPPAKGILKKLRPLSPFGRPDPPQSPFGRSERPMSPLGRSKRPMSPLGRSDRPMSPLGRCESPSPGTLSPNENPLAQSDLSHCNRPMSPVERAMSPLGIDFENALGILDDVIEQEYSDTDKKVVKKSVSFGELPEVKKFSSDSSDSDLCDGINLFKKSVSTGDIDVMHTKEDLFVNHRPVKKSVSFTDISPDKSDESVKKSVSFDDIVTADMESSLSDRSESDSEGCTCDKVCTFEVEVKVVDIQPQGQRSHGQSLEGRGAGQEDICKELDKFNILVPKRKYTLDRKDNPKRRKLTHSVESLNMICHHPGCSQLNENRPLLLCKECDNNIHSRPDCSGHLVLDTPKRKSHALSKFVSTPNMPNSGNRYSSDEDEANDEEQPREPVPMETDAKPSDGNDAEQADKKLRRKKAVKSKRRHTTGVRSHSVSDIYDRKPGNHSDEEANARNSYHGSIDENSLSGNNAERRLSTPASAFSNLSQRPKGVINHERFTLKFGSGDQEEVEIVAAVKNVSLREAIQPILERRGLDLTVFNVFVEASNTPLPLNCETFLLGGTTMFIREKDDSGLLPCGTQSLSKATGSKFTGAAKSQSTKSSKSGMLRRESVSRAQSMLEPPTSKQRRSSLQLPFQAFFPTPKLGEGQRAPDDTSSGSLRSRRGINLSVDDSFPMSLSASISPQGTLRDNESKKQKPANKLTTLFSPLSKDKEKLDQLHDLLNTYSTQGLPPPPSLIQIGQPHIDEKTFAIESDWRQLVENSEKLSKRQHDQQEAIWELLQTELHYIQSLRVITDLFLCVVLNIQNEVLLNEIDTDKLFNNISEISNANCEFWKCHLVKVLEESRSTASLLNPSVMKEGFKKYHDLFQPYICYCAKQKVCLDYMKLQYTENELFKTFVIWAETQKLCNRLKLTDLLVKPMQRLTKYSLLLQAILRKTDDERQRKDLLEMIASVDRFVHHVNSTLRQQHEEEKLQAIVDKIESYDAIEAPNDECLKIIQPYNYNFNLTAPMPGCDISQTRSLVMQSPLKLKEYQSRMDVECLLFTDLLLICKASKRMDKYKIVKPPMRVDRIILHELKDKGSFLLIYVNEYHVPVSSFTFHADQNAIRVWVDYIRKAQEMYREARQAAADHVEKSFPQSEIITEEVIGYTPLILPDNPNEQPPMFQFTRCSSEENENQRTENSPPINRSSSWNEMAVDNNSDTNVPSLHYSHSQSAIHSTTRSEPNSTSRSEPRLENLSKDSQATSKFLTVQYSQSYPSVVHQDSEEDNLNPPTSQQPVAGDVDMSLPEFLDENMKSKLYPRRGSRTEKRYYTADAIQEMQKNESRDNSIYKRLSWNFPNGDLTTEKQGVLRSKVMSSDSLRSIHSSSGVSSVGSLHLSPEDIEEIEDEEDMIEVNDREDDKIPQDVNEDDMKDRLFVDNRQSKSKSTSDIVSLMQDLNTSDMKDGISSVDLPVIPTTDPNVKLSHAQLLRMKKQLLLSSANIEASEV